MSQPNLTDTVTDATSASSTTGESLTNSPAEVVTIPAAATPGASLPSQKPQGFERLRGLLDRKFWGLWAIFLITGLLGTAVLVFNNRIIPALQIFLAWIAELHITGYVIMTAVQMVTCVPPFPAFSVMLLANGFVFGFPMAIIPIYIGSVLGGIIAFLLGRYLILPRYKKNLYASFPELSAVDAAVASGNFRVALLIRLAPYAYALMNLIFASTSISLTRFLLITLIANLKYVVHAYVGGYLRTLTLGGSDPIQIGVLAATVTFGAIVGLFLFFHVRKVLLRYASKGTEDVDVGPADEETPTLVKEHTLNSIVTSAPPDGKDADTNKTPALPSATTANTTQSSVTVVNQSSDIKTAES